MNSYQSIGMYLYHTCCRSTRIFGREYYCIDHIGAKSIPSIKLHFSIFNKFQLKRFFNSNHLNECVLKFRVV